jgi:hypothetical protein
MPQHLQRIGAVEYRGLIQLARNGEKELPQQSRRRARAQPYAPPFELDEEPFD